MPTSRWTGGQYSLVRILLGVGLLLHFERLLPATDAIARIVGRPQALVLAGVLLGMALALLLAAGRFDRPAAVLLALLWALLPARDPSPGHGLLTVGALLLLHTAMPRAPYLSWDARNRVDPAGGWTHDRRVWAAGWILLGALHLAFVAFALRDPAWRDGTALERVLRDPLARPTALVAWIVERPALLAPAQFVALAVATLAPLTAPFRRMRFAAWCALLALHLLGALLLDASDLTFGMLLLLLFTFDPAWIAPVPRDTRSDRLFYDGHCGLCHRAVRLLLSEDPTGTTFRFAPLQGDTFAQDVDEARRATLPDSAVVLTPDGELFARSDAAIRALRRLGGLWCLIGTALRLVPRALRDAAYDGVAKVRKRIFGEPEAVCPMMTAEMRARFDA
ncbi:MAG: DUF393 domain-containing protein [Planctomycetes bacterium]|nr:DUF393 domain-containing protein [Planctomycetota bacterium]